MENVKSYLQEVEDGLRSVPEHRRGEEVAEISAHLEAMVAARQEFGASEAEAVEESLRQFGAAQDVTARIRRAHRRATERALGRRLAGDAAFLAGVQLLLTFSTAGATLLIDRVSALPTAPSAAVWWGTVALLWAAGYGAGGYAAGRLLPGGGESRFPALLPLLGVHSLACCAGELPHLTIPPAPYALLVTARTSLVYAAFFGYQAGIRHRSFSSGGNPTAVRCSASASFGTRFKK